MIRYWSFAASVLAILLASYVLVEVLDIRMLQDPESSLDAGGPVGGVVGVSLLVADAFIPVPSSLVMIALGALYGAVPAILLSLTGKVGMAAACFAVGRRGGPLMARVVPPGERRRADDLLKRRGSLAILVSRPIPLLAEATALLAGASPLGWGRAMLAALAGSAPEAVAYSLAGAIAPSFENAGLIWGSFVLVVAVFWIAGHYLQRRAGQAVEATPR